MSSIGTMIDSILVRSKNRRQIDVTLTTGLI